MKPKKLIRSKVISLLKPGEWETITDIAELNKLYELKIREELEEIKMSDHKDVKEFTDLMQAVFAYAKANGFNGMDLYEAGVKKGEANGNFGNIALNNLNPDNPSNKVYFQVDDVCPECGWTNGEHKKGCSEYYNGR